MEGTSKASNWTGLGTPHTRPCRTTFVRVHVRTYPVHAPTRTHTPAHESKWTGVDTQHTGSCCMTAADVRLTMIVPSLATMILGPKGLAGHMADADTPAAMVCSVVWGRSSWLRLGASSCLCCGKCGVRKRSGLGCVHRERDVIHFDRLGAWRRTDVDPQVGLRRKPISSRTRTHLFRDGQRRR